MSEQPATAPSRPPSNRLGLDYRAALPRRVSTAFVDVHTHVRHCASTPAFFEAAAAYGVAAVFSMSPLEHVDALRAAYGDRIRFIAIPNWKAFGVSEEFRTQWQRDLRSFRERGARLCKFWMAPPMRERHGLTLQHDFMQPLIAHALDLGFDFMCHVGDPTVWWRAGAKYSDTNKFGTKLDQYGQLEWFCQRVAPRRVISAHMGGSIEEPDFLQGLLDRHANLYLDTSATKWIVREVARQPERVRLFVIRNAERILFGSDNVVEEKYDFDHYASRYWAQQMMWESTHRGESPIDDPDADGPPQLAGVDLPTEALRAILSANITRLGLLDPD